MPLNGFTVAISIYDLKICLDFLNHFLVLSIGEIHLTRIHLERAAVVGAIDILGSQMEVEVRQLVAVGTIVDFLRIESALHGTGYTSHIGHEGITLFIGEFVEVVHMVFLSHEATTTIGLFLKKERTRHLQLADFNHQVVKRLIVCAVQTLLGITLHSRLLLILKLCAKLRILFGIHKYSSYICSGNMIERS